MKPQSQTDDGQFEDAEDENVALSTNKAPSSSLVTESSSLINPTINGAVVATPKSKLPASSISVPQSIPESSGSVTQRISLPLVSLSQKKKFFSSHCREPS